MKMHVSLTPVQKFIHVIRIANAEINSFFITLNYLKTIFI